MLPYVVLPIAEEMPLLMVCKACRTLRMPLSFASCWTSLAIEVGSITGKSAKAGLALKRIAPTTIPSAVEPRRARRCMIGPLECAVKVLAGPVTRRVHPVAVDIEPCAGAG